MRENIYDLIGIGIGPYNLGLAALIDEQEGINGLFFEQTNKFEWHPGMLIDGANLQVSFLADLITIANPKSPYTYLNYLHTHQRLYSFFFLHKFEIPRQEYDAYARWVANQLTHCHFGSEVVDVIDHQQYYEVKVKNKKKNAVERYFTKHIVLGTGTKPATISDTQQHPNEDVHHSSQYLFHKKTTKEAQSITLVGSGQSAAEIFLDLLKTQKDYDYQLTWLTRSAGLFQLDQSKLGQEIFSPDYVDYFHRLSFAQRKEALELLEPLRNGVQEATLHELYELLYHQSIQGNPSNTIIRPLIEVKGITTVDQKYVLDCYQWQKKQSVQYVSEKVILATGYVPNIPDWFYTRFQDKIVWEDDKRYKVTKDYRLIFQEDTASNKDNYFFTQTNLEHSHGSSATNLALTVDRNVQIVNTIAGKELYQRQTGRTFTDFT